MYRTNFYGQHQFPDPLLANRSIRNGIFEQLPQVPMVRTLSTETFTDSFSEKPSRFEDTLHQEVLSLSRRKIALDKKIKDSSVDNLSAEEQQALMQEYSMIERGREIIALIVDNMQKCAATIAANFR